jgi:type VI secretion system protein VasI
MRLPIAAALLLLCSTAVHGEDVDCSTKTSAQDKYACAMAKLKKGVWLVDEGKSKLDDSPSVGLAVQSVAPFKNRYGQEKPLFLFIRCDEGQTKVYIDFAGHFMSSIEGRGKVEYRVDDKPAKSKAFTDSNDHAVLGLWSEKSSVPWIKELIGAKTLFVRATPFSESAVSGEFPISGIDEAIKPLRAACKW